MMDAEALVFVVDDDASLRASLQDLLESVGLRVVACASAQEFLRRPRPEGPAAWCSMCACQASAGWSCSRNWPMLACWKRTGWSTGRHGTRRPSCWGWWRA